MTDQDRPITEQELHAYVDGQLDATRHAEVEAYLALHPEIAQKVKEHQTYNQGLHALFDSTLQEEVPSTLTEIPQAKKKLTPYFQFAAMIAALAVGTVFGWTFRGSVEPQPQPTMTMVNDAIASHVVYTPEVRHPVEVTVDHEQHLITWLSKRLNTKVRAPALQTLGYELLGGRLLSSEGEPAAQFMYENSQGQRLTLFVRHKKASESQTAFRYASQDKVHGFYWIDGNLGYALIGEVDKDIISNAAHLVYQELNR
ncbi:anti-sigma factor family protein [Kaarinaea lacus]